MNKQEKLALVESALEEFYGDQQLATNLREAVLYSIHAGGKRIRPYLLLEVLESLQVPITLAHAQVAAALEMIHTGSLIHDDLPAMDDDDFRRGRLTNHKKFGEALAILAGDALFLDPYALIARADLPNEIKVDLIASLSLSSGSMGMVAGQVLDMEGEGKHLNLEELQTIHANKTGKLLAFPFHAAGIIAGLDTTFQVRDDILDVTASFEEIGKTPQKDLQAEKSTYPALLGLDEAKVFCNRTLDQANEKLDEISQLVDFDKEPIVKIVESLRINA